MTADIHKFSEHFKVMADRIEKLEATEFAGAILVVPAEGEPIAMVLADPSRDQVAFWATAMGKMNTRFEELQQARPGQTFRR